MTLRCIAGFFVLNAANLSKETEKLAKTMCASLNYTTMKKTFKRVFSDILSLEQKKVKEKNGNDKFKLLQVCQ